MERSVAIDDDLAECGGACRKAAPTDDPDGRNKQRKRGQYFGRNKINRKAAAQSMQNAQSLCPTLARGETCTRGDNCRFDHNLDAFLTARAQREEDEKENRGDNANEKTTNASDLFKKECPNVVAAGTCKFGLLCRFGSSHPTDMKIAPMQSEREARLYSVLDAVRKHELSFERTKAILSTERTGSESYPFGETPSYKRDFRNKLYLAPLTTVGNLPFRRICKEFGVDITCGEMAMCTNILKGQRSEWALLRRHESEDFFGVQVCGGWTDSMTQCAELFNDQVDCDFVDVNMGCPIDIVFKKGMGSGLMDKTTRVKQILHGMRSVLKDKPLTIKVRIGIDDGKPLAHKLVPIIADLRLDALTIHGRTRQQRYTKEADWSYIRQLVDIAQPLNLPIIGNGDILSYEDYNLRKQTSGVDSMMIARGALIKPWIFTEIKEQRYWDIRSTERLDMLQRYTRYALEHFGSDTTGVDKTRRFLLELISFQCRYVPVGILERLPPRINDRPPAFVGRDDLETLMASPSVHDWLRLSELLLGPVPADFVFIPKHKSSSYEQPTNHG